MKSGASRSHLLCQMSEKSPDEQAGQGKSQVNLADLINAKAFLARLHHISSHREESIY